MLDHVILNVSDFEKSQAFYDKALEPLGCTRMMEFPGFCGYGYDGKPFFWIAQRGVATPSAHVALTAKDRATVDAFHDAATAAGGTDNGKPGLRPQYHEHYYGAFVIDPDGNNIEAVCHKPA
jgi:catechol 2,3-dioxygenase-like lactoylglutathione lyase family enzyme